MTLLEFKRCFRKKAENSVPRASLYCVWIPACPGKNKPLIRVWIDPSMSIFESQATIHEPDLAAARSEAAGTSAGEGQAEDVVSDRYQET